MIAEVASFPGFGASGNLCEGVVNFRLASSSDGGDEDEDDAAADATRQ